MRSIVVAALAAALGVAVSAQSPDPDPFPKTVEEFRSAVQNVLSDTGVPGAGLALVRMSGVEWAGGVGLADRDRQTAVTADTHFRAGSISESSNTTESTRPTPSAARECSAPPAKGWPSKTARSTAAI